MASEIANNTWHALALSEEQDSDRIDPRQLSIVLNDIKRPQQRPETPEAAPAQTAGDLDGIFAHLRDEASRRMEEASSPMNLLNCSPKLPHSRSGCDST